MENRSPIVSITFDIVARIARPAALGSGRSRVISSSVTSEVVGTNYTAGGLALTTRTVGYTAGTNTLMLDCDDVVWPSASFTARFAVFYSDTGTATTSPLLCYWDFGVDVTAVTAPFTLFINAAGLVTLAAA